MMGAIAAYWRLPEAALPDALAWSLHDAAQDGIPVNRPRSLPAPSRPNPLDRPPDADLDKWWWRLGLVFVPAYRAQQAVPESEHDGLHIGETLMPFDPVGEAIFGSRVLAAPWSGAMVRYGLPADVRRIAEALAARDWTAEVRVADLEALGGEYKGFLPSALSGSMAQLTRFYGAAARAGDAAAVRIG